MKIKHNEKMKNIKKSPQTPFLSSADRLINAGNNV
jgi:hypothetical protein